MSDKYYLTDCNSYLHSYQNTYRVECRGSGRKFSKDETVVQEKKKKPLRWWQRLFIDEPENVRA